MQENTWLRRNADTFTTEMINFLYDEGIFLFCAGKYDDSIECFDKIITRNPDSKIALAYKGLVLQKTKRPQEAVQYYEKALNC